jgi:hypothetical protein
MVFCLALRPAINAIRVARSHKLLKKHKLIDFLVISVLSVAMFFAWPCGSPSMLFV